MRLEHLPTEPCRPGSPPFGAYRRNVTSQDGEDGILARMFELLGTTNKTCIEFGAADGKWLSNTWSLIRDGDWDGILIEGRETSFRELERSYAGLSQVKLFNRYVDLAANSLDRILKEAECPAEPDLLSIDVDGLDWHIWHSLREFRPRLVLIEFNPTIPNDVLFVPDPGTHHGCSLRALVELGEEKGYELAAATGWNAFFVRRELLPLLQIPDNSISAIHPVSPYETKVFQLYDGSLRVVGNDKLMWSDGRITVRVRRPWLSRWRRLERAIKSLPGIRQIQHYRHRRRAERQAAKR